MIESEQAARAALAPTARGASGLLRITAPAAFGRKVVTPLVPDILAANPELRIDLQLTDAVIDIVGAGIDVAVRIGRLRDSTLIARRLAPNPRRLCASPAYVARAGRPEQLADLAAHDCLTLTGQTHWPFEAGGRRREVRVNGRLSSSSIEAVRVACCGGLGLALLSAWDVADDLAAGRLVALALADAEPEELAIWAVYPTARLIPPKVHAFIEALTRRLRPAPAR
jgi:DNA-binding transcriptional LysR family regulator